MALLTHPGKAADSEGLSCQGTHSSPADHYGTCQAPTPLTDGLLPGEKEAHDTGRHSGKNQAFFLKRSNCHFPRPSCLSLRALTLHFAHFYHPHSSHTCLSASCTHHSCPDTSSPSRWPLTHMKLLRSFLLEGPSSLSDTLLLIVQLHWPRSPTTKATSSYMCGHLFSSQICSLFDELFQVQGLFSIYLPYYGVAQNRCSIWPGSGDLLS